MNNMNCVGPSLVFIKYFFVGKSLFAGRQTSGNSLGDSNSVEVDFGVIHSNSNPKNQL